MRRPLTPAVVLVVALIVAAASCGGDDDEEAEATPRQTTTTERETTTTTLDPVEAEKQVVIAAYEAARQAHLDAAAPPNPDPNYPVLAETHTGYMLDYVIAGVTGLRNTGLAQRLPDNSQRRIEVDSVTFEDVEGQRVAYLEVCTVDDFEEVEMATGAVVTSGVRTVQSSDAMIFEGGVWKLAEQRLNTTMEGVAGCAVD